MSSELSARLAQRYQPSEQEREIERLRNSVFGQPLLYHLMGIPIINDVGITDPTEWILVDETGEEVERGYEPYTCDSYGTCILASSCSNYNNCAEVEREICGTQAE